MQETQLQSIPFWANDGNLGLEIMALATHRVQGSYATCQSWPLPQNRGIELTQFVTKLHMFARTDRFLPLKCKSCSSVGAPFIRGSKIKCQRISAFKGRPRNDESGGTASASKDVKNSAKLSYESRGSKETSTESPKGQNHPLSYTSETGVTKAGSNLFKYWLMVLRTQSPSQVADEISEGPTPMEISKIHTETQWEERGEILKAVWCYFMGLDATVKIPLLIIVPLFMAVTVIHGAEISKELTPLWVLGPLIVALYVKMLDSLYALYIYSFKRTAKVVENLPAHYMVVHSYVARGKLKKDFQGYFWKPVVAFKNLDYKELSKRRIIDLQVRVVERYLDFVESVWPYYCRTIRFLKRANFI